MGRTREPVETPLKVISAFGEAVRTGIGHSEWAVLVSPSVTDFGDVHLKASPSDIARFETDDDPAI